MDAASFRAVRKLISLIGGPEGDISAALAFLTRDEHVDAALLDIRLRGESIAPVARGLCDRKIPFVFYSGQGRADPVHREWPDTTVLQKPALGDNIVAALAPAIGPRSLPGA